MFFVTLGVTLAHSVAISVDLPGTASHVVTTSLGYVSAFLLGVTGHMAWGSRLFGARGRSLFDDRSDKARRWSIFKNPTAEAPEGLIIYDLVDNTKGETAGELHGTDAAYEVVELLNAGAAAKS